ncbi:hypothetical protein F5146DRAFT_1120086 [Armillaria mellea]|nr:hypothetical protein F5146DRAFT_1120086 [Armillaria mellea]
MSCFTCSNCGVVNFLPPESESRLQTLATIQNSDSLVSQLLRESRPLLDDDYALISAEIVELERLRSLYDAQLQEIESRLRPVLKPLEDRKSIFAPIRRVSRDILLEIFHFVCDVWRQDSLNLSGPLWVLGRVCRVWRDTLHTSPATWSRDISIVPFLQACSPDIAGLSRAYGRPSPQHTDHLLQRQAVRERRNYVPTSSILLSVEKPTIELYVVDGDDSDYPEGMCLNSPQLRQAAFISHGIHQMRLPPSGITHYSGYITSAEDFLLLSQLPVLKMCHIPGAMIDPLDIPVVMTELRQLYVGDLDVLNSLTAPVLQSLAISEDYPRTVSSITPFLRRSGCQLESLSMNMQIFQSEPSTLISEVLSSEACSAISHLKLQLGPELVKVANSLTLSSVLPNLHRLTLCMEERKSRGEQTKPFLNMIRSRRDAGLLKTIEVQFFGRGNHHADEDEDVGEDGDQTLTRSHDVEAGIRALTDEKLDMRVERWNPVDLDLRLLFWDGQVIC